LFTRLKPLRRDRAKIVDRGLHERRQSVLLAVTLLPGAAPARELFADRFEPFEHHVGDVAVFLEISAAFFGDGVALLRALGVGGDVASLFEEGQRRINGACAWAVSAACLLLHDLDQLVAVARLLGDQREREQLQVALGEHTAEAGPAAPAALRSGTPSGSSAETAKAPLPGPYPTAAPFMMSHAMPFGCLPVKDIS